ncbi:IclR family transcriptional regulator [Saccharomonospora saliphila]|uniref:IclR family transcriptional regulator n=1 Tax=Saccharomonospora saliphila TaxID=369829 RepID=UPI00036007DA|nr:IclR family transcriptional regulator [Saccharomonospora saliphila]
MSVDGPQERGLVGSARRALRVLEIVASEGDGVTAKAVARRAGFTLSTTYHLLNTLVHDGYLVRLGHGRGFGLGYKLGPLYERLCSELDVDQVVRDELNALHRKAGAAAYYTVLRDNDVVVAAVADSPRHPRARPIDFGFHEAAHATAFGKVLLASLPPRRRREYLAGAGMPRLTERTTVRMGELDRELDQVRRSGYAQDVEEFQPELACVSAPVRGVEDRVTAAIAFSMPATAFLARRHDLHRHAREAATRLSVLLPQTS